MYYYYYYYYGIIFMVITDFLKRVARKSKTLKIRNEVEKSGSNTILERRESNM
jgi:hypothetical protein